MKTDNEFVVGKHNIVYIGSNFQEYFYGMDFKSSKRKLTSKILAKPMNDKTILAEWKPQECTLGDVLNAIKTNEKMLKDGYANIFYARDAKGALQAVYVFWVGVGWDVYAYSVASPRGWRGGCRVFSRQFLSGTLTLGNSDLEKEIELSSELVINGVKYKKV